MAEDSQKLVDDLKANKPVDLYSRGRACIGKGMLKKALKAKAFGRSEEEIIQNLSKENKYVKINGDEVYMEYPKCFCPHAKKVKGKIPATYCKCSEGWVEKLFETALGRPITAEVKESVIRGNNRCIIRVNL